MSVIQSKKVISELEKNFDVNSLYYKDLRVWPLIRMVLIVRLERPTSSFARKRGDYYYQVLPDQQQLASLAQYKNVDYMFISRPNEYDIRMQGKYYSRLIDPYVEIVKDKHSFLKVQLFSDSIETTSPRYIPTVFLKTSKSYFYYPVGKDDITNFGRLREFVLSSCGLDLDERTIIGFANNIEQYRLYFLDLLSHIQPKTVSLVCYYDIPMRGLIWACRDLNITSVDLQHGYHASHLSYEHWSRIPPEGYEVLPDIFHVWSASFKDDIEKTQPAGCTQHRPVVGNNAWMRKVTQEQPPIDGVDKSFFEYLKHKEKVILVTLQLGVDSLPPHLLEAMKCLPHDWLWLMRRHPHHKHTPDNTVEILHYHDIHNYEIENSTEYPLFLLLRYSHHHLTASSSACLESLVYGVPTTFFSSEAYQRYKEHIDMGFFNCVPSSADTLMRFLRLDYDKNTVKVLSKHFFEMDKRIGQKAFEDILNYSACRNFQPVSSNYRAQNYNQVGELFLKNGDLQNALCSFQNAAKADPTYTEAYNNLGTVCWHLGNTEVAAKCIEMALKVNPNDERTLQNYHELLKAKVKIQHPLGPENSPDSIGHMQRLRRI